MADIAINKSNAKRYLNGSIPPSSPNTIDGEPVPPSSIIGGGEWVPYLGAKDDVDLGEYFLKASHLKLKTDLATIPTDQGTMYWDQDEETVAIILNGSTTKVGEDIFFQVKNQSGATIPKGTAVRFDGVVGASGRIKIVPFLANGSNPSIYFLGVTYEAIADGADGKALFNGKIRGVNTSAFTVGDILYASPTVAGGFTTTKPVASNNIISVAAVLSSGANGILLIRPQIGSNINNDEGVKITSPTTGDLLQLQASGLWENKTISGAGLISGTIASGQVAFGTAAGVIGGDSGLFWNNVNKRLGVGTNSPTSRLHIQAQGALSTDIAFRVRNSANTFDIIRARGDGNVFIGLAAGDGSTGSNNVFFGGNAGRDTSGNSNVFIGFASGRNNTTGIFNSFVGDNSGLNNTTGITNAYIGAFSMSNNTTGGSNIAFGFNSGRYIADGTTNLTIANNSVFLGASTKALADNQTNQIVIGHNAIGLGSNTAVLGNDAITFTGLKGNVGVNTTTNAGFRLDVNGTARVQGNVSVIGGSGTNLTVTASAGVGSVTATKDNNFVALRADGISGYISYGVSTSGTRVLRFIGNGSEVARFFTSGNFTLQNGGTFTDAGFRLDVNGTARIVGATRIDNLAGTGTRMVVADANGVMSTQALGIAGSGTLNRLAKFTAAGTVGDSQVFDNGTNVGIGTDSPSLLFSVLNKVGVDNDGRLFWGSDLSGNNRGLLTWEANSARIQSGSTSTSLDFAIGTGDIRMRLSTNNNLLINTTTDAGFRLDVNGTGRFSGNVTVGTTLPLLLSNDISQSQIINGIYYNTDNSGYGIGFGKIVSGTKTNQLTILDSGAATFANSVTATAFFTSSDKRKKDIISQDGDLAIYQFKGDDQIHYGYIAQDMEALYPNQVSTDNDGMMSLNYIEILVKKVHDLETKLKKHGLD